MKNTFNEFWFEGNLYFGMITSVDDLRKVFKAYEGHMSADEVLNKAKNNPLIRNANIPITHLEFGLRSEHHGNTTLKEYLIEQGVEINSLTEITL